MITSNHIAKLKEKLEAEDCYSYQDLYEWSECYLKAKPPKNKWKHFEWSHRYLTLKQSGPFYNNLCAIDDVVWRSSSLDEFMLKTSLLGFPQEAVDFAICYIWMEPGRIFSQDWRELEHETQPPLPPFGSERESTAWRIYDGRYKEISRNHLPIYEVEDFLRFKATR